MSCSFMTFDKLMFIPASSCSISYSEELINWDIINFVQDFVDLNHIGATPPIIQQFPGNLLATGRSKAVVLV